MTRVVVVGSVNVDLVARGERMPLPGETVSMESFAELPGGKGGNQASVAASLGAAVSFVGAVGRDARGEAARADLAAVGVDVSELAAVDAPTGVALILVDASAENSIAIVPGANGLVSGEQVTAALDRLVEPGVVVVACLEIPGEAVLAAARATRRAGGRFILNPAPAGPVPDDVWALCDVVTPNETEAELIGGVDAVLARGVGAVVVTQGGDGVSVHPAGAEAWHLPAARADVVDTTGAGDAFTAGLAVALAAGEPLDAAVRFAAVSGAIATEGAGARGSLPTQEAVLARI